MLKKNARPSKTHPLRRSVSTDFAIVVLLIIVAGIIVFAKLVTSSKITSSSEAVEVRKCIELKNPDTTGCSFGEAKSYQYSCIKKWSISSFNRQGERISGRITARQCGSQCMTAQQFRDCLGASTCENGYCGPDRSIGDVVEPTRGTKDGVGRIPRDCQRSCGGAMGCGWNQECVSGCCVPK